VSLQSISSFSFPTSGAASIHTGATSARGMPLSSRRRRATATSGMQPSLQHQQQQQHALIITQGHILHPRSVSPQPQRQSAFGRAMRAHSHNVSHSGVIHVEMMQSHSAGATSFGTDEPTALGHPPSENLIAVQGSSHVPVHVRGSSALEDASTSSPSQAAASIPADQHATQLAEWTSKLSLLRRSMLLISLTFGLSWVEALWPWMCAHLTYAFPPCVVATNLAVYVAVKQLPTHV